MMLLRSATLLVLAGLLVTVAALAAPETSGAPGQPPDAPAASATLTAVSDTYLDEANPTMNFGIGRSLLVGRTDARVPIQYRTLVQFDLSAVPAGAIVDRAELRLQQLNAGTAASDTLYVDEVGASWEESAATWNGLPPATYRGDPPALLDQTTGAKRWDVRQIVGRWLGDPPAPNYGFLLRGDGVSVGTREFSSRELAGQEPALFIEYHLPLTATATATSTPTSTATFRPTATVTATPTPSATATSRSTVTVTPTATRGIAASLFVTPKRAAPGAQVTISGYGFRPGAALRLRLACPAPVELGTLVTDSGGGLRGVPILPVVPPGPCVLAAWDGGTAVAETTLTILPAMTLTMSPQQGPPGTVVSFTVTGLTPFELRLDYDGAAVLSPAPVKSDRYTGSFVVPNDRPAPLGAQVTVQALNVRHGQVVGTASSRFLSEQGAPVPHYRVTNLQLPGSGVAAGSAFTITGQIVPAPPASLAGFEIIPIWQQADGRRFPLGNGSVSILPDGSFQAPSHVPSLLTGDPGWPQAGDKTGVILKTSGQAAQELLADAGIPWFLNPLTVLVVDAQTGQIIPEAKVALDVWDATISAGSLAGVGQAVMAGAGNQVAGVLGMNELTEDEKAQIEFEKYLCKSTLITQPVGVKKWEVTSPALDQALSEPVVAGWFQLGTLITNAASAASGDLEPAGPSAGDGLIHYLLTVSALDQGYGLKDAEGNIKEYALRVNYNPADHTYRTLQGALLPNPYTVLLQKLGSGDQSALGPIITAAAGIGAPEVNGATGAATFRRYYSTAGAPPGTQVKATTPGSLYVVLTTGQYAKLGSGGMKLYVDGVVVSVFTLKFYSGYTCKAFGGKPSAPYHEGRAPIPNTHLLSPGIHNLAVSAQLKSGQSVFYNYQLQVDPLPAAWFQVAPQGGPRTIQWAPGVVSMGTPWLGGEASTYLITSGAETEETGPLDNRSRPTQSFAQTVAANDHKGAKTSGQLSGQALNKDGAGCTIPECKASAAKATSVLAQPAFTQSFGPTTEEVVPEVKYKIPGLVAGIPFVASVSVGGILKYGATVTYEGQITVFDDASVHAFTKITPKASVGGGMYVDAYILAGLVTYSSAELTASMGLQMPVTYDTQTGTQAGDACFTYSSDLYTYSGWLCIPFTSICAWDDEDHENLFGGAQPSGCNTAAAQAAAPRQARPPVGYVSLASNGFGQIMAIWQDGRSRLATSLWDGESWSTPQVIPTGLASTGPRIAFLTPQRAIAAWTETDLTEAQLPGLTGADVIKSQRIAYALWDGAGWSAVQSLTVPSLGDGGVALAACPEWQAGCPVGGEVVVVWERNLSADFNARRIRLYYAIYRDGAWSAAQPVDAGSAATDILPAAAYRNGTPLVAWVRDGDTDLTEISSRRIALRSLPGGAVSSPGELPGAILEVALAVDDSGTPLLAFTQAEDPGQLLSNRRPLWAAKGNCAGDSCTWQPHQLADSFGRTLYAEHPNLAVNPAGQDVITFRGVGFGGELEPQPGDAPGMISGKGDLAQVVTDFTSKAVVPTYLTQDAAVNWMPAAVYDPALDLTVSTVVKGPPAAGARPGANLAGVPELGLPAAGLPVAVQVAPDLPDFVVTSAVPSSRYPGPLDRLSVSVRVANAGAPWAGSTDSPLQIVATWDGGPGVGKPAGQASLASLSGSAEATLDLVVPVEGLDKSHELFITVNPGLTLPDRDAANNALTLAIGGVSAPTRLWAEVKPGSPLVFLNWDQPAAGSNAGYRIYRAEGDASLRPIGSALAPGYVDLTATTLHRYRYAVSGYSETGAESEVSAPVNVTVPARRTYLPVVAR